MSEQIFSVITGIIIIVYSCTGTVKSKIKEKINERNNNFKTNETYNVGLKLKDQATKELVRKGRTSYPSDENILKLYDQINNCINYINHEIKIKNLQNINIKPNTNLLKTAHLKRDANKLLPLLSWCPQHTDDKTIEMELNEFCLKPSKESVHLKEEGKYLVPVKDQHNRIFWNPIIDTAKRKNKIKANIQDKVIDSESTKLKPTSNKQQLLSSDLYEIDQNNSATKSIGKLESLIQMKNDRNHTSSISVNSALDEEDPYSNKCGKLSAIINRTKINCSVEGKQNTTESPVKEENSISEFSHKYLSRNTIDIPNIDNNNVDLLLLKVLNYNIFKAKRENNTDKIFSETDDKDCQDFMYYLDQINKLNLLEDKLSSKQPTTKKCDTTSASSQLPDSKIIDSFF